MVVSVVVVVVVSLSLSLSSIEMGIDGIGGMWFLWVTDGWMTMRSMYPFHAADCCEYEKRGGVG